jgi:hypothetical protein
MTETGRDGHFGFDNVPTNRRWRITVAEQGNVDLDAGGGGSGLRLAPKEYQAVIEVDADRRASVKLEPAAERVHRGGPGATDITPEQVARVDAPMRALLDHRDELKAELEQQLRVMLPEHPRNVRLRKVIEALDRRIEAKRQEFAARPDARRLLAGNVGNYYVGGSVPHPGAYPIEGRVNLLQALIAAGLDVNANAAETVRLFRRGPDDKQETVTSLTVKELIDRRDQDVFLLPEDTVLVGAKRDAAPQPEKKTSE